MKIFYTILLMIAFTVSVSAQAYIGKSKDQITKLIPKEMPGFAVNSFGKNPDVNSLKFYDSKNDRSLVFFFDEKNNCKYYKLIEDIEEYETKVEELNKLFKATGNNKWTGSNNGITVNVSVEKSDYIMTILYSL